MPSTVKLDRKGLEAALANFKERTGGFGDDDDRIEITQVIRDYLTASVPAVEGVGTRDPYEVANQLEGYVDPTTPERLAIFLLREGAEASKLADEIVLLRAALTVGTEPKTEDIRRAAINEVLDLLTAHELYRYRPKAFDGFIEYARTELAAASEPKT